MQNLIKATHINIPNTIVNAKLSRKHITKNAHVIPDLTNSRKL